MKISRVIIQHNFHFICLVYSPNVFQVSLFHNWAYGFLLATIIYKGCIGRKLPESTSFSYEMPKFCYTMAISMKVKSIKNEWIRSENWNQIWVYTMTDPESFCAHFLAMYRLRVILGYYLIPLKNFELSPIFDTS